MLSVVHFSPTALSHTQRHCRHAQLGRRLLKGRIRLHKLYGIFLQPASLYASTITSHRICFNCSHSCEIPCIPMFYGCLLLQSLPISLFASLAFWYPSLHLCIFSKLFALVDGVVCFSRFDLCEMWTPSEYVKICMENVCSGWCDNALLLITLPGSLLCLSRWSKYRHHTDNMWIFIPIWAVSTSSYAKTLLIISQPTQCVVWGQGGQGEAAGRPMVNGNANQSCCSCCVWRKSHRWPAYNPPLLLQ